MATGFSRSIEGGYDIIYDYCCTTCAWQNLNAEVLYYCKDCRKLLCKECNKYHEKYFEGHRVFGWKEVAEWEDVASQSCKEVKPVSEVSKGTEKKSAFKSFSPEAASTQARMITVYDRQEDNIKMLQKAKGEITATFEMTTEQSDNFKYKGFAPLLTPPDHVYSLVKKRTYNVKTHGDEQLCYITGICQLPDGHTAILDQYNSKVKLLKALVFCVLDELELPPEPQDICHTTETELAVTVYETVMKNFFTRIRREIQFIDTRNGKLSHTRSIQLDHNCYGIAYHKAQLYVGSCNALYVYNPSGEKVKKIYEDTSNTYYEGVKRCRFSDDGSRIYVTNSHDDLLLLLDSSGQLLSTFSDHQLQQPTGVCVADNGSVFVCGGLSHTVLQVDREGKRKMTTLATKDDGVCYPRCLCYDRKTHTLLVGQGSDGNLLALQLK